jgi:cytochrome P450
MELERAAPAEAVDLSSVQPAFGVDPFPTYDRLRTSAPVAQVLNHGLPGWLVTRYEDVRRLLTDPRLSNDPRLANPAARAAAPGSTPAPSARRATCCTPMAQTTAGSAAS